jgi:hypothetical protein
MANWEVTFKFDNTTPSLIATLTEMVKDTVNNHIVDCQLDESSLVWVRFDVNGDPNEFSDRLVTKFATDNDDLISMVSYIDEVPSAYGMSVYYGLEIDDCEMYSDQSFIERMAVSEHEDEYDAIDADIREFFECVMSEDD